MSKYDSIDLNNIINSILVEEGIRNALLIQPADYDESNDTNPKMTAIQEKIKSLFPDLIFSKDYNIYQGVIVSKKSYDGEEVSLNRMGEILGYPCYKDFGNYNKNNETIYLLEINIIFENGSSQQLLANVCKNKEEEGVFKDIAEKAEIALKKPEYKDILKGNEVKNVTVILQSEIPSKVLIDKLMGNQPLHEEEKEAVLNILYNFGFGIELQFYFQEKFQYDNPLHRGILLGLIIVDRNNLLSPFFPLQKYPEQDEKINELTKNLENEIIDALEKTKNPVNKGGRKTRRRRDNLKKRKTYKK
jgi:hypothetical protein